MNLTPFLLTAAALSSVGRSQDTQRVFVELTSPPAGSVLQHQAERNAQPFQRFHHAAQVQTAQDLFLSDLADSGFDAQVTTTTLFLESGPLHRDNRFSFLINGLELEVTTAELARLKAHPSVKHVTADETFQLHADNSVEYVRASDGAGQKTIFSRNGGALERFDGEGQVIAILDTGIEHTHPCFDTRFSDVDFMMRTGDTRPVRTAGTPYQEGTHHPKVVYFLPLSAVTNEDDVGHGTHAAGDSAGLKVQGPGLDRIPGNADDQVIEGVAPGALLMNYKVCETTFTCVGTTNIITALEDALSPLDPAGNPKPVATVINMSFGGGSGDPNAASSVASDNAALAGAVMVSSAGNSGPGEQTVGAPSAGRRVICVGATNDPGESAGEVDVLPVTPLRYGIVGMSTGAQDDTGAATDPADIMMPANLMGGAPAVEFGLGQHFVYCGLGDTPEQVPDEVNGRIALIARGSTIDLGVTGTGTFANKVAQATSKGAVAILIFNNVEEELEGATAAASTIPVYGLSKASGEYLRDTIGFESPLFSPMVPATWGTISSKPIRLSAGDGSSYAPATTSFSSRGSIVEARYVKPDVTAPGLNVYGPTIAAGGASTGGGTMSDPSRFISVSGTSFSGPHVAGAAALVRQAMLDLYGMSPLDAADLRAGAAASMQLVEFDVVPQSLVRAALTNTATNLRLADGITPVANGDARTFQHEIGAGLIHVVESVDARAALGTNELNGNVAPDSVADPDFLPSFSFGSQQVVGTGDPAQAESVRVTLENLSGASAGGIYTLSLVDTGDGRGDVTAPIAGTTGFQLNLSSGSVVLGGSVGDQAVFDVAVEVDGTMAGLQPTSVDAGGIASVEFLWYVVATGTNGESLRMPFLYRAVSVGPLAPHPAPFLAAITDDVPGDQTNGVDRDGKFRLSWSFPPEPVEQACEFLVEVATLFTNVFSDDAEEILAQGANTTWESESDWVSVTHPTTGTQSYSPVYIDEADTSLSMIDALALPAGTRPVLSFTSYEDIEQDFDFGFVEVSADDGPYFPVARYTGLFDGQRDVDLTDYAGRSIRIRFHLVSDQLVSAPAHLGWFIDDIKVDITDFMSVGTVGGTARAFDVTLPVRTPFRTLAPGVRAQRWLPRTTYTFRVRAFFDTACNVGGPFSNLRAITVDGNATESGGPQ